ncbi:winged helix-turn-helix domain-containing protein [Streptomyces chrestomyceticus]|uniref:winged helix-turn-helix domain-containing protein n=1 Tax=Streptomyces chrestomyceticus TaxID=68185 RepID=UPI0027DBA4DB|nr:winged helix-turn-helix domain-containing protein [Streptomyces chrestomyceticus]
MSLRVHFTAEDLLRVRVVRGADALWETVLSATLLPGSQAQAVFGPWRRQARTRLRLLPRQHLGLLRSLIPPTGDFPDFLTPYQAAPDLATGIDQVMSTPARRLRRELTVVPELPRWAHPLAAADLDALTGLAQALRSYHHAVLAPAWPRIRALVDADRSFRARVLLDHGTDGLLESLRPVLRWTPPVLEADYPVDRDLRLGGRGLLLVPSVFCRRTPVTFIDPALPPVLVYPVAPEPGWSTEAAAPPYDDALARLLGHSRAQVLRAIEHGCTTGELARRVGISPPTASQHAAILREANLIISTRRHNSVLHTLTPAGAALLHPTGRSPAIEAPTARPSLRAAPARPCSRRATANGHVAQGDARG